MAEQIDLAPTPVARLIKQTLPPMSTNQHSPDNYRVSKEFKAAVQRAGGLFALYLAHTAAAVSRETGRAQVTPEDVLGALEELDMDVLVQPTNDFVKAYRKAHLLAHSGDDVRPTRPSGGSSGGGGGHGSKKSSGGSSKRKASSSGGSSKSKKSSSGGGKKVKANVALVDLRRELERADPDGQGEDGEQDGVEADDGVDMPAALQEDEGDI